MRRFSLRHLCAYAIVPAVTPKQFLETTPLTQAQIARICEVDVSQVSRWKNQGQIPEGAPLLHLVELSGGKIKARDLGGTQKGQHFRRKKMQRRSAR